MCCFVNVEWISKTTWGLLFQHCIRFFYRVSLLTTHTLWQTNMAIENGPFEDVFSIENLIFQPVMLVFWRVTGQTQLVSEEKREQVWPLLSLGTPHPCGSVKGKSVKFPNIANRHGIKWYRNLTSNNQKKQKKMSEVSWLCWGHPSTNNYIYIKKKTCSRSWTAIQHASNVQNPHFLTFAWSTRSEFGDVCSNVQNPVDIPLCWLNQ